MESGTARRQPTIRYQADSTAHAASAISGFRTEPATTTHAANPVWTLIPSARRITFDSIPAGWFSPSMRKIALLLGCLALIPSRAKAEGDEASTMTLQVGEKRPVDGFNPVCDDPSVATISGTQSLSLEAVAVGSTVCSVRQVTGARMIFKVVVIEKKKKE
jgi:hypothetical protein